MRRALSRARRLALVLVAAAPAVRGEEPGVAGRLVANAWYWQARAREDKAEATWNEVLAADPRNPDALAAVAGYRARQGRLAEARVLLGRLRASHPASAEIPVVERQVQLGRRYDEALAEARRLVHAGRVEEGVARYRELFGSAGPPGSLALEYYQVLGGRSPEAWGEARDGLRDLTQRAPREPRYRLALAKLLTYREETRHEGIAMLEKLSRNPTVADEATASWRRALLWLPATGREAALLKEYADRHPADEEIAARLAAIGRTVERERKAERRTESIHAGFDALRRNDIAAAKAAFEALGEDDPDARVGLAIVAQREAGAAARREDFARARELLLRAKRLAPAQPELWQAPLRSATFWGLMQQARADRAQGRDAASEAKLLEARDLAAPDERWRVDLALGDLALRGGRLEQAENRFRGVLAAVPDEPDALRGLASALVAAGRFEEALETDDRLARAAPAKALPRGPIEAEVERGRAGRSRAAGRLDDALRHLEAARKADPASRWVLHDLANLRLERGEVPQARALADELLRIAPALPEARVLEARILVAEGQSARALEILRALPAPGPDALALRRRLELQRDVAAAARRDPGQDRTTARRELLRLDQQVAGDPQLEALLALAWARMAEYGHAAALMRDAIARSSAPTGGLELELASILFERGDDADVGAILDRLEHDSTLTEQQQRDLGELRIAHAVRAADRLRERGELRAASLRLDPALKRYPDDARLLSALGRLFESEGDHARSHATFLRVLERSPRDLDARRGAVDGAVAMRDLAEARRLADEGIRLDPNDPRAQVIIARVDLAAAREAEQNGNDQRAMRSLKSALALTPPVAEEAGGPDPARDTRAEIQREMRRLEQAHQPGVEAGFDLRQRSGEHGLGSLAEQRETFATSIPFQYRGRLALQVGWVQLDAGTLALSDVANRFGTLGSQPGSGEIAQQASGTQLRLSYEGQTVALHVGTTPLGFPIENVIAGLRIRERWGPLTLSIEGFRRPITDSLLSYAGMTDPATGKIWGGVLSQGGRLELSLAAGPGTYYAFAGADYLSGIDVAENLHAIAGAGLELAFLRGSAGELLAGVSAVGLGYDKNLSFFTLGQGGYFSPQRFLHAGLPLRWRRNGALHWDAVVEPAFETFVEADTPQFPLATSASPAMFLGRSVVEVAVRANASIGYLLADRLDVRLGFTLQEAVQFSEATGGVVVTYGFGGKPRSERELQR